MKSFGNMSKTCYTDEKYESMLISPIQIILESLNLYKKHFKKFVIYALLFAVPTALGIVLALVFILSSDALSPVAILIGKGIMVLALGIINIWIGMSLIEFIADVYGGSENSTIRMELKKASRLIVPGVIAALLTGLITLGGLILLIIPGLYLGMLLFFSLHAVVIEGKSPMDALHASKGLVQGRWWQVFWRIFIPALLFGVALFIINLITGLPFDLLVKRFDEGTTLWWIFLVTYGFISYAISALLTPLTTAAPVILYLEMRKNPHKKE